MKREKWIAISLLVFFIFGTVFVVRETWRLGSSKSDGTSMASEPSSNVSGDASALSKSEPEKSTEKELKEEKGSASAPTGEDTKDPNEGNASTEVSENAKNPLIIEETENTSMEEDDRRLKPGTNHNHRAEAYAYSPEDVRRWLKNGEKEPDYPTKKLVFLTIDDGPILATGSKMLDTLEREGVGATFFYQGSHVAEMNREQMKRVIGIGSSIAVHSYSHDYKLLYPNRIADTRAILSDYDRALKVMREVLGEDFQPKSYRYPGGHMSWKKLQAADEGLLAKGVHWMDWNISVADSVPNVDQLPVDVFMKNVRTGTEKLKGNVIVLLMHETHKIDAPLLEEIIRYYKGLGVEFGILK